MGWLNIIPKKTKARQTWLFVAGPKAGMSLRLAYEANVVLIRC
jgi:hypothetical protein